MMLHFLQRILLALTLAIALPALAQSDPPARVGRLAHIENQVDFRVDRNDQGGPATLNWPISSGAVLETGQRGRAEVWIGSTAYRLADDSRIEFSVVDDARVDVRMSEGSLAVSILDRDQVDDVVIATPDGNVRFLTPGRYRIDVFGDRSELSVQAGRAVFDDSRRATPVAAGQKLSRWSDGVEQLGADLANDAFDRWVSQRENVTLASQSRRHVSPHMTGYQDLDAYGDWQTAPDYGAVWYPRTVAEDWAPYRYGRWAWVAPWGWTWIDQAPWGFAPFHYGRWAIIHGRWGWVPGRLVARPVYAPALVAWIGNPGWNVGFSFGAAPAVGWFPLAPREVYVPGFRHSPNYVRQINVTQIQDVKIIDRAMRPGGHAPFAHHASPRAVTVVPANLVREGRSITSREIRHQDRPELGRAPLARQAPNADWLAPAQGAVRPHSDERREAIGRPRRDVDAPRPNFQERGMPRPETMPRQPDRPAFRQPMAEPGTGRDGEMRREGWRGAPDQRPGMENRERPFDASPVPVPQPQRRDAVPPEARQPTPETTPALPADGRRGAFRRPGDGQPTTDAGRMQGQEVQPQFRREMPQPELRQPAPEIGRTPPAEAVPMNPRERFRQNVEGRLDVSPRGRPPESMPMRGMPTPEMRAEERQPRPAMPPPEREKRREMPEMQRMERSAPSEAPQVMRQPEMPRPAPEVRMPAPPAVREMPQQRAEPPRQMPEFRAPQPAPMPQPRAEPPRPPVQEFRAPPPAPMPMPQQRMEPPRQQAPQGGGQPEKGRRHGDDDGRGR